MKVEQWTWTAERGWEKPKMTLGGGAQLALVFGGRKALLKPDLLGEVRRTYPNAHLVGGSTAGEIAGGHVLDDSLVVTGIHFDDTQLRTAEVNLDECKDSFEAGQRLAEALTDPRLVHVLVISDGQVVNGSELVKGMTENLRAEVAVTGGLAGDGARFEHTFTFADHAPAEHRVAAVGFYGEHLKVGYGSLGGWDPFGPLRRITKSKGNVLYELDGQPALALYKRYLGEHASGLPATGLLFPLSVKTGIENREVVRTILNVDEATQSLTFAGDVPEGSVARLMKANFDRLVDGAHGAAETSYQALGGHSPELAILISCVGRKLVLKQRTEDEVEAVRDVIGKSAIVAGFYSYGEICPAAPNANCELHNQTMTITTLSEG